MRKFRYPKGLHMKRKVLTILTASIIALGVSTAPANAHVSIQLKGSSDLAGTSSRIWMSLGHGCTYQAIKYGTSIFSVKVPASAGKPTPEFHQGFKTSVVASTTADATGTPDFYTVTWTAKSRNWVIDDGTFYDFGLKVTWSKVAQKINFETTQTCFGPAVPGQSKKPLFLRWTITDGTTKAATDDTEFGPAPSITTK